MRRRRRRRNPKLEGRMEDRISEFIAHVEKLASYGWKLHSHLHNHPELSKEVKKICDACDEGAENIDGIIDELTKIEGGY